MAYKNINTNRFSGRGDKNSTGNGTAKAKPQQTIVKTWVFDSVGNRKYALQIKKAANGNPCLKIVEGVPQDDGTYRRFDLTIWSEDFPRLFQTLDEVRTYMTQNNIKTPEGHKYDPNKKPRFRSKGGYQSQQRPQGAAAVSR